MPVPSSLNIQKMILKLLLFLLSWNIAKQGVDASVSVTEVHAGQLAELPCLSSDDLHRFMFWQLSDDRNGFNNIIGPGNPPDQDKYDYEVLTGKLFIRGVSTTEAGLYKCISKGIENNSDFNVHVVELIVTKNGFIENSFEKKLLWGMAGVMVVVVGIAVTLFIMILKRKNVQGSFDAMVESRENSPAKYVGQVQSAPVTPAARSLESGGLDNLGLDVDFPKVFQQMQKGQNLQKDFAL